MAAPLFSFSLCSDVFVRKRFERPVRNAGGGEESFERTVRNTESEVGVVI